jgi:hypothetical protein
VWLLWMPREAKRGATSRDGEPVIAEYPTPSAPRKKRDSHRRAVIGAINLTG